VGSSTVQVSPLEARTLVAEAMLHSKEYRQQAMDELTALTSDSLTDNGIAHRALAWAHLQNNEFEPAGEELREALDFSANDPWTHYYFAWMKYHVAQAEGTMFPGLANMMQDLRIVLDWNTEFAEAHHMLAMARVQGGGINSAIEAIQAAVKLDPRNEDYVLDMARVYTAGKKWDTATALFEHLKSSRSQHIAAAARQSLEDIPTLKKYGLLPQRQPATPPKTVQAKRPEQDSARDEEREEPPTEVAPDKRKVEYLKGKLVSIDCSQAPAAVLRVLKAGKTLRLRTENYKSLLLIGEEDFSCAWQNRTIVANYKAGGKADGDLVSLEVQ
jgi:tetratricopeptide (TPR) repeat protein